MLFHLYTYFTCIISLAILKLVQVIKEDEMKELFFKDTFPVSCGVYI